MEYFNNTIENESIKETGNYFEDIVLDEEEYEYEMGDEMKKIIYSKIKDDDTVDNIIEDQILKKQPMIIKMIKIIKIIEIIK